MKIKKLLAGILAIIMICSMLTACGGSKKVDDIEDANDVIVDKNPGEGSDEDAKAFEDAYVEAMSSYIVSFEELMTQLGELLDLSSSLATDEEVVEWCQIFVEMKDAVGAAADDLAEVANDVPEGYEESHAKITIATAAVYDAMTGFENMVDAAINGDDDAFTNGLVEFMGNMEASAELWEEAIER